MKVIRRIELTTGSAEWDEMKTVRIGDRLVPQRIDVNFPSTADRWPALDMTIELRDKVPVCTAVHVTAQPGGREVRSLDLRAVTLESWVENIVAEAAVTVTDLPDGSTTHTVRRASEREFRESRQMVRYARQGARRTVTDDLLRQVADIYRMNVTDRPVEAVQGAFDTSHRTAARYVQTAREKGFLPPTTQGKVTS